MTAVEWLVDNLRKGEFIFSADELIEQAKQMEKEQNIFGHKLVKVYDPINPESTIKNHIIEAYNAGYEDAKCNHINDAEQYYLNKYKPV